MDKIPARTVPVLRREESVCGVVAAPGAEAAYASSLDDAGRSNNAPAGAKRISLRYWHGVRLDVFAGRCAHARGARVGGRADAHRKAT